MTTGYMPIPTDYFLSSYLAMSSSLAANALLLLAHTGYGLPFKQDDDPATLTLFNETFAEAKSARCLDGSPAGFYTNYNIQSNTKQFVIYLQGGGLCSTDGACKGRSSTALGSSTKWAKTKDFSGILSTDLKTNPDFHNWAHIYVPYCSGDVWSGTIESPSKDTFGLYFSGHRIVDALVDFLIEVGQLDKASDVILTGSSAGGVGTYDNIDYVAGRLSNSRVVGVPQGGWYFPYVSTFERWQKDLPPDFNGKQYYELYQSHFNADCQKANANAPWACASVNVSYPFIRTPLFVAENMYDKDKILTRLGCPAKDTAQTREFVYYYGLAARHSMEMVGNSTKNDGIYMPACFDHTGDLSKFTNSPLINGSSFATALGSWYFNRGTVPKNLVDTCTTINCTPGCPGLGLN